MLRVLVVDDYADVAQTLAMLARLWGYNVWHATSGPAALALAAGWLPHVAVLDLAMPGMDGYELGARLRALPGLARLRLVAQTGLSAGTLGPEALEALEARFELLLLKPIDPARWRDLLEVYACLEGSA